MLDWISLMKARFVINIISNKYALLSTMLYVIIDITLSFSLIILLIAFNISISVILDNWHNETTMRSVAVLDYLSVNRDDITLLDVVVPSTLLTSVWALLLLFSSILAMLLIPIDHLRRFTAWWFRDVDKRPLTALAKVMGTLIIIGAGIIKTVRWFMA